MFCEFTMEDGKKILVNMAKVNGLKEWGAATTMIIFAHNDTLKVKGTYEEIKHVIVGAQDGENS